MHQNHSTEAIKTVLFIPGFEETIDSRDYRATMRAIESRGYNVVFVPISWSRKTIDDWVVEFGHEYAQYDPADTILAGFSFGATTAFVAATHRQPVEVWLFSLSPYFAEDFVSKNMKKSWVTHIGHRRADAFRRLSFAKLQAKINAPTILFYGQNEIDKWPVMAERAYDAKRRMRYARFVAIPDVGHDIADPAYIQAIVEHI